MNSDPPTTAGRPKAFGATQSTVNVCTETCGLSPVLSAGVVDAAVVVVVGIDVAGCAVSVTLVLTEMRWVPISERRAVVSELAGWVTFQPEHPGQHSPGIDTSVFNASSCLGPVVDLSRHSGADAWKRVQGDACAFGDP